ncbi:MAG: zinc ABC transporter substrate-binding protein [Pseudomonadota bacterium]|nr:zinc ABC transporter substrate-binding protein [Pseudomonadota bacterium]
MLYRTVINRLLIKPSLGIVLLLLCWATSVTADTRPTRHIMVSMRPIALLVQELTQGLPVQVTTLLPQGATPHDYALKPSDLRAMMEADLVVWLGEAGEPYLEGVVARTGAQIAWSALPGLVQLPPRPALHEDHQGGHDHHHVDSQQGHHHSTTFDLHFWFSVDNAVTLADAVEQALLARDPKLKNALAQNKAALVQRLQQQRDQSRLLLAQAAGPFMLSHDAYYYLEQDLGIQSEGAISLDPEIKPGVKHLMAIKGRIEDHKVRCVISDPSVSNALLNKVDTQPPLVRLSIDPLAWDYQGNGFSEWLSSVYVKMVVCTTAG